MSARRSWLPRWMVFATIAWCTSCLAPRETCADTTISAVLGYSFGHASFDSGTDTRVLTGEPTGNEPLLAVITQINRLGRLQSDIRLAFGTFGSLVSFDNSDSAIAASDERIVRNGDMRRSLLGDITTRYRFLGDDDSEYQFSIATGLGMVFDAQDADEREKVPDAKSYIGVGPSFYGAAGENSYVRLDLLLGFSEVMTDEELRDWSFGDSDDWRILPRLRFTLADDDFLKDPLVISFWGDLGFSEEAGDTFVLAIAKRFWPRAPKSTETGED